jgi:hypothetical protein
MSPQIGLDQAVRYQSGGVRWYVKGLVTTFDEFFSDDHDE